MQCRHFVVSIQGCYKYYFFFQAEDGIRDYKVTGVQTCALPIWLDLQGLAAQVQAALHEDWPTARLAALCHMSAQRFHARFVELAGQPPQAWLRGLRLDAAERGLARGLPLEATALRCGYASASGLAYALRRDRGVTARPDRG